jgi:hypothetical protein
VVFVAVWEAWVSRVVLDAEVADWLVADLAVVGAVEVVGGTLVRCFIQGVEVDLVSSTVVVHVIIINIWIPLYNVRT